MAQVRRITLNAPPPLGNEIMFRTMGGGGGGASNEMFRTIGGGGGGNRRGTLNNSIKPIPAMTVVESQRAAGILRDIVDKLAFLNSITPDVMLHRDELSKFVGDEITRTLMEQRRLEARYQQLIAQRAELKGVVNKTKYKELQQEIQTVSHALRQSTNQLCRNLKENPNISGNLLKIEKERTELMDILERTIRELGTGGTFNILLAKVEEDRLTQERLTEVVKQEKETSAAVAKVELELRNEMYSHKRIVAEQQKTIARLKQELQAIKYKTLVETKYARREAKAKAGSKQRVYEQEEKDMEAHYNELKAQQEMEQRVHDDLITYLRDKQKDLSEKVEIWTSKSTQDLAEMEAEYQRVKDARQSAVDKLEDFRQRRQLELDAEDAKKNGDRLRLQEEQKAGKMVKTQTRAAKKIQKAMLGFIFVKKQEAEEKAIAKKVKGEGGKAKAKKRK